MNGGININKIEFINFNISGGLIEFSCNVYENDSLVKSDELYFKLSEKIIANNNLIALSLSTLCKTGYDEIYMDLEINSETLENIKLFCNASIHGKNITVKGIDESIVTRSNFNNKVLLNFSGGLDSLGIYAVLQDVQLISMDFEGGFYRESDFFNKFNPLTLTTNLRQLGYNRSHWTYMGIGAILFSDYVGATLNIFGKSVETEFNISRELCLKNSENVLPFQYAHLNDLPFLKGLSEIGHIMLVAYYYPFLIKDSLKSLSNPGTEKRFRKELLTKIILDKYFDSSIDIEFSEPPAKKVPFGSNRTLDFLTLYMLKNTSLEMVENTMSSIPDEAIELADRLSLQFYEKFNTNYLHLIPPEFRRELLDNLVKAQIYPYNYNDFMELREVGEFLSKFHDNLKRFF